jgi:hypothetical protein
MSPTPAPSPLPTIEQTVSMAPFPLPTHQPFPLPTLSYYPSPEPTLKVGASTGKIISFTKISSIPPYTLDSNDFFGHGVTEIGDFNADGVTDVVVGAYGDDDGGIDCGALYLICLESTGEVKTTYKLSNLHGSLDFSLSNFDRFGFAVTSIGDHDQDGVTDLLVGAYGDDDGGADSGAAYVLFLSGDGTLKSSQKISRVTSGESLLANEVSRHYRTHTYMFSTL